MSTWTTEYEGLVKKMLFDILYMNFANASFSWLLKDKVHVR